MELNLLTFLYLIASVTFIVGLKMLSHPATARNGNRVAAIGMTLAILGTIFLYEEDGARLGNYAWIFGGILIGTITGTLAAKRVKMTAMPEMVSLFNGMGGACAALISLVEFDHLAHLDPIMAGVLLMSAGGASAVKGFLLIVVLGLIIGSVSFAGSIIAWGKLNGSIKDFSFKGQHIFNILLLAVIVALAVYLILLLPANAVLI
ncbi:MAG: hypothetical protein RIS12_1198, partial [Bacteroidota bacterium]